MLSLFTLKKAKTFSPFYITIVVVIGNKTFYSYLKIFQDFTKFMGIFIIKLRRKIFFEVNFWSLKFH